jgi:hypothetical protein
MIFKDIPPLINIKAQGVGTRHRHENREQDTGRSERIDLYQTYFIHSTDNC